MTRLGWSVLLLLGIIRVADAIEVPVVQPLEVPPLIRYRIVEDVNGDGLADVLIVTTKDVRLWWGRKGAWKTAPDRTVPLPKGTAFFDVGRLRKEDRGLTLLARSATTWWALPPQGEPRKLSCRSGPGLPSAPANVLWRTLVADVDADGHPDLVDVSLEGYRIEFGGGGSVLLPPSAREELGVLPSLVSQRHKVRQALGDWASGQFNEDRHLDFGVQDPDGITVYFGDEKNRFDPKRRKRYAIPEVAGADLDFVDLNGDGRTDLLGIDRYKGRATLLYADPKAGFAKRSRLLLTVRGWIRSAIVEDWNGDGRLDLALPYSPPPAVKDAVRWFLRGDVVVQVPIFLNRGGAAAIPRRADRVLEMPVKVKLKISPDARIDISGLIVVEHRGDFNGDGRRDLLVTRGSKALGVYLGTDGRDVIERDEVYRIQVPDAKGFDGVSSAVGDVNGDGLTDVLLQYEGGGVKPDRAFLLLSRKD